MSEAERQPLLATGVADETTENGVSQPPKANLNQVSNTQLYWILAALWTTVFLGAMDGTIVATLQQPIGDYFQKGYKASYIGTSYLLSICCFTPLYGRLSDILGRRGAMLLALSFFTTGTLLCGLAPSMDALIVARLIAGMGGGGVMSVSSIVVTDLVPLRSRGLYQGLANICFGAGAGLGGPLGGFINDTFGWRTAFYFQVPFLTIASILVSYNVNIILPRGPLTIRQKLGMIDWLGSLTLVVWVGTLLLALSLKATEDLPWRDPRVGGLLIISAITLAAFIFAEAKVSPHPIMPTRLLVSRTPLFVAFTNFFGSLVSFSVLYNVPLYFMAVRLQTSSDAGLHLLPNSVALSIGSVGAGWIMRHTGQYWRLIMLSTTLSLIATIRIAFWDRENTSEFELWFDIVPNGLGFSATLTSTLIAIIACVPRDDMAVATGITYLFRTTGQVLGVSLSGTLFQYVLIGELKERMPGPDAVKIIDAIQHDAGLVRDLHGVQREAAIISFSQALRVVFFCQVVGAFLAFLCALPIEERSLPGTHEEHDEGHHRRQDGTTNSTA